MQLFEVPVCIGGKILGVAKVFGCWKPEGIVLLIWFICSEFFGQVSSQIWVTFWNHTEHCRVHRLDEVGLLRTTENSAFCVFFLIE